MSDKIKFFALGGLDENGKNISVLEINDDIFVLDVGIKYPNKKVPGVDCIIPNYNYLKENAHKIRAYIISHAHHDQSGALPYLYRKVPAPIYCSKLTAAYIEYKTKSYGLKPIEYDFHYVDNDTVTIAGREFTFMTMTHSVPGTLSVAIDTDQGYIVYTTDFIIDYGAHLNNRTNFKDLLALPMKKDILLLITESCSADKPGHCSPNHRITPHIQRLFQEPKGRIFIANYSQNLYNIRETLELAIKCNKKILMLTDGAYKIFGQELINVSFEIPKSNLISPSDINRIREQDLVVLIDGQGEKLFETLMDFVNKQIITNITFTENDTFVLNCPTVAGTETIGIEAVDNIYRSGAHVINLTRKEIFSMHAHEEDIKMLITMLKPKYYLPIKGDFKQMMANAKIALSLNMGYNHNNIFVFDNGMALNIENGVAKADFTNIIENGDILVDGIGIGNVVDSVIEERIKMANDGVIILGAVVSSKEKRIITAQDVQMRGFVFLKDSENIVKQINSMFEDSLHTYLTDYYENKEELIEKIKDRILRYVRKETKKQPIIIPNIIDIDEN